MTVRPRPPVRPNITCAFYVGELKLFVTLSRYEDGAPMEVFIDAHKEGSTVRALLDAIGRLVSRGWQRGVEASEPIDQFVNTVFEPSGFGRDHPAIEGRRCTSLLDALARVLAHELGITVQEAPEL